MTKILKANLLLVQTHTNDLLVRTFISRRKSFLSLTAGQDGSEALPQLRRGLCDFRCVKLQGFDPLSVLAQATKRNTFCKPELHLDFSPEMSYWDLCIFECVVFPQNREQPIYLVCQSFFTHCSEELIFLMPLICCKVSPTLMKFRGF